MLSYLETQRADVDEIADLWATGMDATDKEVFQLEWSIVEDNLQRLVELAAAGHLSDDQFARYRSLQETIAARQPTLQRLFTSE